MDLGRHKAVVYFYFICFLACRHRRSKDELIWLRLSKIEDILENNLLKSIPICRNVAREGSELPINLKRESTKKHAQQNRDYIKDHHAAVVEMIISRFLVFFFSLS